jgi:Mn2+/Fe2+ NRAMP family transporter
MPEIDPVVAANREILTEAQAQGTAATLGAFTKLSGPGWLQSAVTLGGGSLAGALFLGILGGTNLLWLQLMAITMGVVMLSAISYVTLSTGERPFRAINTHINPVLGWGWLIATCMANIIWAMPQFALCYAALQKNLIGPPLDESAPSKLIVSVILLSLAFTVVLMNGRQGAAAKAFDMFLKLLIAMVVICFVGVVIYLGLQGQLNWGKILSGFIPNLNQWSQPTGEVAQLLSTLPQSVQDFWSGRVVSEQRSVMIGAAATAVGINMTFLMPYSMLSRGWDKPFRGLARFDLCTGMAIPYVLVTSCVVIAAATMFHAAADEAFLSSDVETMKTSSLFEKARPAFAARVADEMGAEAFDALDENAQNLRIAQLDQNEKRVASSLVKRNAFQLSQALSPLLGERTANLIFGIGILGMGFSTIIILMLINGYAFCELLGKEQGGVPHFLGCLVAGVSGALWFEFWDGEAKLWLAILASSFGMMLLPIAYFTFFMMMNSKSLLGDEKPTGFSMLVWNVLMLLSVAGAVVAAAFAIYDKANHPVAGRAVIAVAAIYLVLVVLGFIFRRKPAKLASS